MVNCFDDITEVCCSDEINCSYNRMSIKFTEKMDTE